MTPYYRLIPFLAFVLLTGCGLQSFREKPTATILDSQTGEWITPRGLPERLKKADYVIVGELHNSRQMRDELVNTLETVKRCHSIDTLAMDVLKPAFESSPQHYLKELESTPPAFADRYRPLLTWAEKNNVKLLGVATPRDKINDMRTPEGRQWLKQQTEGMLTKEQEQALHKILDDVHPSKDASQPKSGFMLCAQQLHDYFAAQRLVAAGIPSVLITRAFHARKDLGVKPYIEKLKPDAAVVTVLMLEPTDGKRIPQHEIDLMRQQYDFIWVQPDLFSLPATENEPKEQLLPKEKQLKCDVDKEPNTTRSS